MKDHRIYVRVAADERQLFQDLADYYGEDMSTVLRRLVRETHRELAENGRLAKTKSKTRNR